MYLQIYKEVEKSQKRVALDLALDMGAPILVLRDVDTGEVAAVIMHWKDSKGCFYVSSNVDEALKDLGYDITGFTFGQHGELVDVSNTRR